MSLILRHLLLNQLECFMNNIPAKPQSPQSLVLRFMREKRQLTILAVGKKVGIKPKTVDHMENGRRFPTEEEITLFLNVYEFSLDVYNEMLLLKPLNKQMANHYFLTLKK